MVLIVIDGSDGSGKKTQSDLLLEKLNSTGKKVAFFDFPNYSSFFGKMIAQYLNGEFGDINTVDPHLISLVYASDRLLAKERIVEALKEKKVVVCNRYIPSNLAHQSARVKGDKENFIDWIRKLEYDTNKMPKADLTIYLHVPFETAQRLVDKKEARDYTKKKRDIHEADAGYLKKVEEQYEKLCSESNWERISCVKEGELLTPEAIHSLVWENVQKIL